MGVSQVALEVRNLPANGKRRKRHGFDPWVGKIPWRRAQQPTPVFLPEESHGQEEPGGLRSKVLRRVGHDWSDSMHARPWKDFPQVGMVTSLPQACCAPGWIVQAFSPSLSDRAKNPSPAHSPLFPSSQPLLSLHPVMLLSPSNTGIIVSVLPAHWELPMPRTAQYW